MRGTPRAIGRRRGSEIHFHGSSVDWTNLGPKAHRDKPPPLADVIRRVRQREIALGWLRFIRHVERERRMDVGEPLVKIERP